MVFWWRREVDVILNQSSSPRRRAQVSSAQWDGAQFRVALSSAAGDKAPLNASAGSTAVGSVNAASAGGRRGGAPAGASASAPHWSWEGPKHGAGGRGAAAAEDAALDPGRQSASLIADLVWVACGSTVDARRDAVLRQLAPRGFPARILGGLPVLDSSCRWPGLPLYFVGPYAALSVGAGAALPPGHRMAAEVVAEALARHAAAAARGERPYEAAAGAIPLDALFDDEEFADPRAPLPPVRPRRTMRPLWRQRLVPVQSACAVSASPLSRHVLPPPTATQAHGSAGEGSQKRPTRDSSGRVVLVDASDIDGALLRVEVTSYSWSREPGAFELEVRAQFPEPVSRGRCRAGFGERAAELWVRPAAGWEAPIIGQS